MVTANIDISIIIVNYKSWAHLKQCLLSIIKIVDKDLKFEVIIIDNDSNDDKLDKFSDQFPAFTFVLNTGNNGFSNGCNAGAKVAKGEFLLFLNPDTIISKKALKTLFNTAKRYPEYELISCNKTNSKGELEKVSKPLPSFITLFGLTRSIYRLFNKKLLLKSVSNEDNIVFPNWLSGSLILMSKEWFYKLEGWNEDYWMYYEDVDISKRTIDLQGKIALAKDTSIIHNHGGASRINVKTTALTKSEVIISRHIYIRNHFKGGVKFLSQLLLAMIVLIEKFILAVFGLFLFFKPKLLVNVYLFINMLKYYFQAIINRTWLSKRSMNYKTK
ncbi:MAG: glycosyltransferase family 2 protein [Aureibaculum sp.]|nr:glycosyltransferase family 2 protein [Aureibaculum sp.]